MNGRKLTFCTLFDSKFLPFGLTMYRSLQRHCTAFHLYIFAFDDDTFTYFNNNRYGNITVISLKEFEDDELIALKSTRSTGEYCWTCTPSTISYVLKNYSVDHCTYIDADLFFFSDPGVILEENRDASVIITSHNYAPEYDQSVSSGIYCVQYVYIRNDARGRKVLQWWRERCNEWCFAQAIDGKFGDQKYLDDWNDRFDGVHVVENHGAGLAPWNVKRYDLYKKNGMTYIRNKGDKKNYKLIFYHFHSLRINENMTLDICISPYELSGKIRKLIYGPYIKELTTIVGHMRVNSRKELREIGISIKSLLFGIMKQIRGRRT